MRGVLSVSRGERVAMVVGYIVVRRCREAEIGCTRVPEAFMDPGESHSIHLETAGVGMV